MALFYFISAGYMLFFAPASMGAKPENNQRVYPLTDFTLSAMLAAYGHHILAVRNNLPGVKTLAKALPARLPAGFHNIRQLMDFSLMKLVWLHSELLPAVHTVPPGRFALTG